MMILIVAGALRWDIIVNMTPKDILEKEFVDIRNKLEQAVALTKEAVLQAQNLSEEDRISFHHDNDVSDYAAQMDYLLQDLYNVGWQPSNKC